MKRFVFLCFLIGAYCSQNFNKNPTVTFLPEAPVIDGMLDRSLQKLPRRTFNEIWKSDPNSPLINKEYRIAYGASFMYLYIEVEADSFICRDRGYQNGDGFILVLAVPRPDDKPTDEFYVMGFSPQAQRNREWQRKMIWYRNIDLSFKRLTKAQFGVNDTDGKIGFELLLPWDQVYPHHPWLSESIGFNLTFVKAMPENGKNYHFVVLDEYIGSEQQKRRYIRLNFEKPQIGKGRQSYLIAERNYLTDADSLRLLYVSLADSAFQDTLEIALIPRQERTRYIQKIATHCESGLAKQEIILNISKLTSGDYLCKWTSSACNAGGTFGLTILPEFDFYALAQSLDSLESRISPGSLTTMTYKLQHIYTNLTALKIYDTCPAIRSNMMEFLDIRDMAVNGKDVLAHKIGIFRRAYRSKIDNSLQPYSVKIPKDYVPAKKYPLFVYLHGSGEDDQKVLAYKKRSPGNFIELAPFGRGTSTCYSIDNAQQDIQEAIEDVIANYSVDTTRIVLAGFSMGGYGVYRTHFEYPERFKALAIFSGHPDLANNWGLKGHHPNFLDQKNVTKFKGMPVFIFHGTQDRNCPFEVTQQLVQKLKDTGADVAFYTEDVGHQAPGKKITQQFFRWLNNVIQK